MKQFKNNNGRTYDILEQSGKYSLLKLSTHDILEQSVKYSLLELVSTKDYEPYVVAFLLDEEAGEWNAGSYFPTLESAQQAFDSKKEA